jgi:hypothetical protein
MESLLIQVTTRECRSAPKWMKLSDVNLGASGGSAENTSVIVHPLRLYVRIGKIKCAHMKENLRRNSFQYSFSVLTKKNVPTETLKK